MENVGASPAVKEPRGSRPFVRYFIGSLGNDAGAALTGFLISIIAVVSFEANAAQMGALVVFQRVPVVLFALFAGVIIDRVAVRSLLIAVSMAMACLLITAPIVLGNTESALQTLYLFAFLIGTSAMVLDIALTSILPLMIPTANLVGANASLSVLRHSAAAAMPPLGGALIKIVLPAFGLLVSAGLYVVAALSFLSWKGSEGRVLEKKPASPAAVMTDIREGLRVVWSVKVLRAVILSSCAGAFSFGIWTALMVLLLSTVFSLTPFEIGLVVSLESLALVAGSAICPRVSHALGPGRTLIVGNVLSTLGITCTALGVYWTNLPAVIAGALIMGVATPLYSINQISIRQAITPRELMGRANASRRFLVFSFLPVGAFLGGELANNAGLAPGFALSAMAMLAAALIAWISPLRHRDFEHLTEAS